MTIITHLNSSGRFKCMCGAKAEHGFANLHHDAVIYLCRSCGHDLADTLLADSLKLMEADYDQVSPGP